MKILEVNKFYYRRRGAEQHLFDLIALLKEEKNEIAVFAMDHPENKHSRWNRYFVSYVGYNRYDSVWKERIKGIGRMFGSKEARNKIEALLDDFDPDVVHLHNIYHQISPSILKPIARRGIPILMTVHDHNLVSPDKDKYYPKVGKAYWKFLFVNKYSLGKRFLLVLKMYVERLRNPYRFIDHFIVPSVFLQNAMIRGGYPQEQVSVIPHFVTPVPIKVKKKKKSSVLPALYLGSISRVKNVDKLIEIFESLKLPLVLAGNIEDEDIVPKYSRWVKYVGHKKTRQAVARLIATCRCVITASELSETFGLIGIEAGLYGKPIVAIRTGALGEVVTDGVNGILVENIRELERAVQSVFSGSVHFAPPSRVKAMIRRKYGKKKYLREFNKIVKALVENELET